MRALLSKSAGGPETLVLEEIADPVPESGQVVVQVEACSINYPDGLMIRDLYQFRPERPYSPGSEIAGVVRAVGNAASGWKTGDRVIAMIGHGGLAEQVAVECDRLFRIPDGVSFEEAAALLMTYGTSYHGLHDRGHISPGQTLLILGAAGGVGLSAIELGKLSGARVVAAVSSEEKAAIAREAGADETLVYPRAPFDKATSKDLAARFKQVVGPEGADIIYDIAGGDYSEPALRSIAWEGRFLVVGFPAGIANIPLNLPLLKSCDICGVFWGGFMEHDAGNFRAQVDELLQMLQEGKIRPRISGLFPLERAADAITQLEERMATGKLVVTMNG
ncbi:MAG: NADPH:quinone oxidoreductase family protein [Sphingomonadaceae bacterium]